VIQWPGVWPSSSAVPVRYWFSGYGDVCHCCRQGLPSVRGRDYGFGAVRRPIS
jgi:hypothetical protein